MPEAGVAVRQVEGEEVDLPRQTTDYYHRLAEIAPRFRRGQALSIASE